MIQITLAFPHSTEHVWRCLTQSRHIEKWWGNNVRLETVKGGRFAEDWTAADGTPRHTEGKVTAIETEARLQLDWQDDGWPAATRVEFILTPDTDSASSEMTLLHSGWDIFADDDARRKNVDKYLKGWNDLLQTFGEYLSKAE